MKLIRIFALLTLCTISCYFFLFCNHTNQQITTSYQTQLKKFPIDDVYKKDIQNASKIINDNDLIITLTHLQMMDKGGKKYYLLEKDTLSNLLNSITKNLYCDIILINWEGTIIYSMSDDSIFARNISEIDSSPFSVHYAHAMEGESFATECCVNSNKQCIIASPLEKETKRWGVLILIRKSGCALTDVAHEITTHSFNQ